jgi:CHAT domain-containing protein
MPVLFFIFLKPFLPFSRSFFGKICSLGFHFFILFLSGFSLFGQPKKVEEAQIAAQFLAEKNYPKAAESYKKAIVQAERKKDWRRWASLQAPYLEALYHQNLVNELISFGEIAADQREKFATQEAELGKVYNLLGVTYFYKKRNANAAKDSYEKALAFREKVFGKQHPEVGKVCYNLAIVYESFYDFENALSLVERAIQIQEQHLKATAPKEDQDDLREISRYYTLAAALMRKKGDNAAAEKYCLRSMEIDEKINNRIGLVKTYELLALLHKDQQANERALEYALRAYHLSKELYGEEEKQKYVSVENTLGTIYQNKQDYHKALIHLQNAYHSYLKLYGKKHDFVAKVLNNLGRVYSSLQQNNTAVLYHRQSLQIFKDLYGELHNDVAWTKSLLASAFFRQQEYDSARLYAKQALDDRILLFGHGNLKTSDSFRTLASFERKERNYSGAYLYLQEAISSNLGYAQTEKEARALLEKMDFLRSQNAAILLHLLKEWADVRKEWAMNEHNLVLREEYLKEAYQIYQTCERLIDFRRKSLSSKSDKIELGNLAIDIYASKVALADLFYKKSQKYQFLEEAFLASESGKAVVLLEAMAEVEAKTNAGIPDSLLEKEKIIKNDLAKINKEIADNDDRNKMLELQNQRFELNRRYEDFVRFLETQYPNYYNLKLNTQQAKISEVQAELDEKTAVISYLWDYEQRQLFSFLITAKNISIQRIENSLEIEKHLNGLRNSIIYDAPHIYLKSAYILYQKLIPTLPKKIENIVFIPDGKLNLLPFEALLTKDPVRRGEDQERTDYEKFSYLLEKYNISYSYSATLWLQQRKREKSTAPLSFLAFAPSFTNAAQKHLVVAADTQRSNFTPIPATLEEVRFISQIFTKQKAQTAIYLQDQATEYQFKALDLTQYRYVHLATHGFINESRPELSGVALYAENQEDGILYLDEIFNLQMKADLVLLSACETGLGKISRGEGVIGLSRALLYAGADNVCVSLWKVADNSTSLMMRQFFQYLLPQNLGKYPFDKARALRQAKLQLIKQKKYARPYYWSPFIMIGK